MKKKLKDKIWRLATIKIDRLVEQYKCNVGIENKTKCFLITIEDGGKGKVMFRCDDIRQLWKEIKYYAMVCK